MRLEIEGDDASVFKLLSMLSGHPEKKKESEQQQPKVRTDKAYGPPVNLDTGAYGSAWPRIKAYMEEHGPQTRNNLSNRLKIPPGTVGSVLKVHKEELIKSTTRPSKYSLKSTTGAEDEQREFLRSLANAGKTRLMG